VIAAIQQVLAAVRALPEATPASLGKRAAQEVAARAA
jgi:hypothetical protein